MMSPAPRDGAEQARLTHGFHHPAGKGEGGARNIVAVLLWWIASSCAVPTEEREWVIGKRCGNWSAGRSCWFCAQSASASRATRCLTDIPLHRAPERHDIQSKYIILPRARAWAEGSALGKALRLGT